MRSLVHISFSGSGWYGWCFTPFLPLAAQVASIMDGCEEVLPALRCISMDALAALP
jgi:hypothetical protein